MKRLLAPLLTLLLLAALSLGCAARVEGITALCCSELDSAAALAAAERWEAGCAALARAQAHFSENEGFLHAVIKHDDIDEAAALFAEAASFGAEKNAAQFSACAAKLRSQLRLMAEEEALTLENIL